MMRSSVWRYFTKTEATKASCKLCSKTLKTGGGTSNLKQHLIHKHPKIEIQDGVKVSYILKITYLVGIPNILIVGVLCPPRGATAIR